MNNKRAVVIIIIVVILFCGMFFFQENSMKKVIVNDVEFSVPSKYQDQQASIHLVKLTSGENIYFINVLNSSDVKFFVNDYVVHKNTTENKSVNISKLDYADSTIYKSVVSDNSSVIHYWFLKDGKTCEIYTGTADSNTDNFILDIIKS